MAILDLTPLNSDSTINTNLEYKFLLLFRVYVNISMINKTFMSIKYFFKLLDPI